MLAQAGEGAVLGHVIFKGSLISAQSGRVGLADALIFKNSIRLCCSTRFQYHLLVFTQLLPFTFIFIIFIIKPGQN